MLPKCRTPLRRPCTNDAVSSPSALLIADPSTSAMVAAVLSGSELLVLVMVEFTVWLPVASAMMLPPLKMLPTSSSMEGMCMKADEARCAKRGTARRAFMAKEALVASAVGSAIVSDMHAYVFYFSFAAVLPVEVRWRC